MTPKEKGWCAAVAAVCAALLCVCAALAAYAASGRIMGMDACGNAALARNIARGVYPDAVCETCGAALDGRPAGERGRTEGRAGEGKRRDRTMTREQMLTKIREAVAACEGSELDVLEACREEADEWRGRIRGLKVLEGGL